MTPAAILPGPSEGLAALPKFRLALARWMRQFDRTKHTGDGPIEATIAVWGWPGHFVLDVTLAAPGGVHRGGACWPLEYERDPAWTPERLSRTVACDLARAHGAMMADAGYVPRGRMGR